LWLPLLKCARLFTVRRRIADRAFKAASDETLDSADLRADVCSADSMDVLPA
jgi:hypothetical protein